MASGSKAGRGIAKVLGIPVDQRNDDVQAQNGGFSNASTLTSKFVEKEPTAGEFIRELVPTGSGIKSYFRELFPFLNWITRYNLTWLTGDLIAGLTVGAVVVPQGMAYALLAKLAPEYGLYTSFVGFLLYWAFATSKDITIGTVAVMSTLVGNIVIKVQAQHKDIPAEEIARTLALICGIIVLFIGLARIGWIVEWISLTAISAFMTGSAISIGVGQVPGLLGIPGINNRDITYKVVIATLKALPKAKMDAAMGMTALFLLYGIRILFNVLTRKFPRYKKTFFFLSTLRIAFVLILYILISWLVNRHVKNIKNVHFKILGPVPSGFKHVGAPKMNIRTIKAFASELPAAIIVLLIEHIAISKSFGRINNYTINPSQELVAIGFSNVFGPFLGGYPATGSFSRTAIKSKAGVRTPLAGIFTAVVVLLALYALTSVFYYIPSAGLSAVIIHAVGDLITPPNVVYQFWQVSPLEVPIFFIGVFVTIFSSIENGIYATIASSAALMLYRTSRASGRFLGRVKVHSVPGSTFAPDEEKKGASEDVDSYAETSSVPRDVFLPLDRHDGSNPEVDIESPLPGVFIYKFSEGFNYPNSAHYLQYFTDYIFANTRRTTYDNYAKLGDRPWNDPGPKRGQVEATNTHLPILRSVILDFSAVNNVDVSSVQNLIDVRNQLDRYAAPEFVQWHFASIQSRWTRRALASAGFGLPPTSTDGKGWTSIVADIGNEGPEQEQLTGKVLDIENVPSHNKATFGGDGKSTVTTGYKSSGAVNAVPVFGVNRPYFHLDVLSAVESTAAILAQSEGPRSDE